jgi:hypothetical protein
MINDIDKTLRQLFIRELGIHNGEIRLEFRPPTRDWASRLNRPTLNLFLHDVRENKALRQTDWEIKRHNGQATRQRTPIRLDLHYMITAWAAEPEDEHHLLSQALLVLFLHPELPAELLPEPLQDQPRPIQVRVAQYEMPHKLNDVWGGLDNEIRPAIDCTITMALNPYQTSTQPLVKTLKLHFSQAATPFTRRSEWIAQEQSWLVGGYVRGRDPLSKVNLTLVERGLEVPVAGEGQFIIGHVESGVYTLRIQAEGREPSQRQITVPSPSYDIELE